MAVMKIGANYKFKNDEAKENYRSQHRINKGVAEAIEQAGGVFRVMTGEYMGDQCSKQNALLDEVQSYIHDINGNVIYSDRNTTLINQEEMEYFEEVVEVIAKDPNEAFAKTTHEKLMAIYKSYHPDTPDSKITVVGLRKAWDMHNKNILELAEKIEILTKTLAQRKEML